MLEAKFSTVAALVQQTHLQIFTLLDDRNKTNRLILNAPYDQLNYR